MSESVERRRRERCRAAARVHTTHLSIEPISPPSSAANLPGSINRYLGFFACVEGFLTMSIERDDASEANSLDAWSSSYS